jgi:cyclohexadienyl dehydratase
MRLTRFLAATFTGIAIVVASASVPAAADKPGASGLAAGQGADELYALVGKRLSHMRDVAAFKWLHERPVEDLTREQVVVEAALAEARNRGLRPGGAEVFFSEQIAAAKDIQHYWFERWDAEGGPLRAPDLAGEIRPRLLELGEQIIISLGQDHAHDSNAFATLVATEGLPADRVERLYRALRQVERYDSRLEQVLASGTLRVGTTGDYAPFSEAAAERGSTWAETLVGVDIELARDLAAALGVAVVFVPTSWPTLSADLEAGRFDVAMSGVSRTLDRARIGHLSLPYYVGGKTPITRCEDRQRFGSLQEIDQPGVRVIVNPGGTNERFVDEQLTKAEKVLHPDNRTIFAALLAGDADLMVTDSIEVTLQTRRTPGLCGTMSGTLTYQEKAYLMPPDAELARFVDTWLSLRLSDGTVNRVLEAHLD